VKLDPTRTAFGRHETFPLRYAWLTKGFGAICDRADIFSQPDRAMVRLGVGRNMVNAIQYWLQAARLVTFAEGRAQPTNIGDMIMGEEGDRFLEDETTLWLLHWLITSNAEMATGFFWFFNRFALPRFQEADFRTGLADFVAQELRVERSQSTLKSDTSTLLRMYAPAHKAKQVPEEDHLDTPMAQLRLVEQLGKGGNIAVPVQSVPISPRSRCTSHSRSASAAQRKDMRPYRCATSCMETVRMPHRAPSSGFRKRVSWPVSAMSCSIGLGTTSYVRPLVSIKSINFGPVLTRSQYLWIITAEQRHEH
jgi:hypothetical protein